LRLSEELVQRMKAIGVAGKQLTLKIMTRAADADLDPPKFMGHGRCDTTNASHTFSSFTIDAEAIAKVAVALLDQMHIAPEELRGIALNMQKLNNATVLDRGQQRLQFATSVKPKVEPVASTSKQPAQEEKPVVVITSSPLEPESDSAQNQNSSIIFLPEDTKLGTKARTSKRSRSPSMAVSEQPKEPKKAKQAVLIPLKLKRDKGKGKAADFQTKITKGGVLHFDVPNRAMPDHRKISDNELLEYNIDPSYFRAISITDRMDVLSMAWQTKRQEDAELARQRAALAARNLQLLESSSLASQDQTASLNAPLLPEPAFRRLRDIDAIRDKLSAWVAATDQGPAVADVSKLQRYLLACLDHPKGGHSADLERVGHVLKWLKWLIGERDSGPGRTAWLGVFDKLLAEVQQVVIQLRGRPLYLEG
jgi:DNA repair protein REV1